jgi:hypothetical protein
MDGGMRVQALVDLGGRRAAATEGITVACRSSAQILPRPTEPGSLERCRPAHARDRTGIPADPSGAVALPTAAGDGGLAGHRLVVDGGRSAR